nr:immunity 22 family protein [Pedobacter panaciterrae]
MGEQRIHIWAGISQNKTEEQFFKYFDQSKFLKGETPDLQLRSQFSKDIGKDYDYDADWITIYHGRRRISIQAAIEELPVWDDQTEVDIYQACVSKGISSVNSILCYADDELSIENPLESYNDMIYIGSFNNPR